MDKKQQDYIRDQHKVRTQPAEPVKRVEMTRDEAEKAEQERREANRKAAAEADRRRRGNSVSSEAEEPDSGGAKTTSGKAGKGKE